METYKTLIMRTESLICSEELFKALSPVSGNIDWAYVWSLMLVVQDVRIQPVLGQQLYQRIMSDIEADTLEDPYKGLVEDFIARTVVWYTMLEGLPWWVVKIANSGVVTRIVDDGNPIDLTDADKLGGRARTNAEFYKQRLIDYLCAHSTDFPEYLVCESGDVAKENENYSGGLNLEGGKAGGYGRTKWYL